MQTSIGNMHETTRQRRICLTVISCLIICTHCSESDDARCDDADITCDIGDKEVKTKYSASIIGETTETAPVALVLGHPEITVTIILVIMVSGFFFLLAPSVQSIQLYWLVCNQ